MPYLRGLGADVSLPDAKVAVGRLQAAINRIISGARDDATIAGADAGGQLASIGIQAEARATPLVAIDGVIGNATSAALRTAAQIADIITGTAVQSSVTTVTQMATATQQLNAAAAARGYPIVDNVSTAALIADTFGAGLAKAGFPAKVAGVSTTAIAIGAVVAGVGYAVYRRRKAP